MLSEVAQGATLPSEDERRRILVRAGLILAEARALADELDRERRSPLAHLLASRAGQLGTAWPVPASALALE